MLGLHWLFSARTLVNAVNSVLAEKPVSGVGLQPEPRRSFDRSRYVLPGLNGLSGWHLKKLFEEFETISLERHPLYWWQRGRGRIKRWIASLVVRSSLPTIVKDAATSSIACILRKPGPAGSVPLSLDANSFSITPLQETVWALTRPARLTGRGMTIRGAVPFPQAYAAVSAIYRLPTGARVAAAGTVRGGGLSLGLLDRNDQWATQVAIPPGSFRQFLTSLPDRALGNTKNRSFRSLIRQRRSKREA
jgi:hypothetical protein